MGHPKCPNEAPIGAAGGGVGGSGAWGRVPLQGDRKLKDIYRVGPCYPKVKIDGTDSDTFLSLNPPKVQKKVLDLFLFDFVFSARMHFPPKKVLDFFSC